MESVSTINDIMLYTLQLERLSSLLMTFFGLAALLMATLGIYGVVSYFVRQRTMRAGTRGWLGAVNDLVALVLGGGLKLSLVGIAVGSIGLVGGVPLLVQYSGSPTSDGCRLPRQRRLSPSSPRRPRRYRRGARHSCRRWSPFASSRHRSGGGRVRMQRAVRDIRQAVGGDDSGSDVSAADVLTAFVDAARSADSYWAPCAVLASVCDELKVESAALLVRQDGSEAGLPLSRHRRRARGGRAVSGGRRIPDHPAARLSAAAAVCAE